MIGIRNASVLPVPVCAVASTSLPWSACGITAACTGVGDEKRAAASVPWYKVKSVALKNSAFHLLSLWRRAVATRAQTDERARHLALPVLFSIYAEDIRRRLKAGILSDQLT